MDCDEVLDKLCKETDAVTELDFLVHKSHKDVHGLNNDLEDLWSHFKELFTLKKRLSTMVAREHQYERVRRAVTSFKLKYNHVWMTIIVCVLQLKRFAEAFFTTDHPKEECMNVFQPQYTHFSSSFNNVAM